MKGRIYVSGAFTTVNRSVCGGGEGWLDNDPHFWTSPPTWGICRTDLRRLVRPDDYVFFVLPAHGSLPQMVYGYLRVRENLSHLGAYHRPELRSKRMKPSAPGRPNGNIIVTSRGKYNQLDGNEDHKHRFERIKEYYVIGDRHHSKFLSESEIRNLAPFFPRELCKVFDDAGKTAFEVISRWGRVMNERQVNSLLVWLNG